MVVQGIDDDRPAQNRSPKSSTAIRVASRRRPTGVVDIVILIRDHRDVTGQSAACAAPKRRHETA
jgi:hypothetical protein